MIRIISSDILIADVITPLSGSAALSALVAQYELKPGSKTAISREQFEAFSAAVAGLPVTIVPGGSSANVLVTLAKLLPKKVEVQFLGVAGHGISGNMIHSSLTEAGIRLIPEHAPESAETAVSYVMLLPDGQRIIATWPGNARELLKTELITEGLVRDSDAALVQGSLWWKMEQGYADRLLTLCRQHNKEIWLALPTYSRSGNGQSDLFGGLLPAADLVLGNEEELIRICHGDLESSLKALQRVFREHGGAPVGFITLSERGAALVDANTIEFIPPAVSASGAIVNTLGAGDTAFAGFAAGHLRKLPPHACAELAMQLAAEKLKVNGPRLPDPLASLAGTNFHGLFT
jgi:sugar/nucleoside kinase (ribokinase family)